jgi:hypothetical protein
LYSRTDIQVVESHNSLCCRLLDAERRSLLAVTCLVVLTEDVTQNFWHTIHS